MNLSIMNAGVRRIGRTLLKPTSLSLSGQGTTVLIGPNGAGKTTLLKLMHGLERPRGGAVEWHGCDPQEQSFVFQRPVMLRRTVRENLELPLKLRGAELGIVDDIAAQLDLTALLDQHAPWLSGGEAARLSLARALITRPRVLFLDEPTANLDGPTTRALETHLSRIASDGVRLILATHAMGQARRLADEVLWVEDGHTCGPVPAGAFFESPQPEAARAFMEGQA